MPEDRDAASRRADASPAAKRGTGEDVTYQRPRLLYLQAALVALLGAVFILLWFLAYNWLNKTIWDNAFVKVLDRKGLEDASCQCYQSVKSAYDSIVLRA